MCSVITRCWRSKMLRLVVLLILWKSWWYDSILMFIEKRYWLRFLYSPYHFKRSNTKLQPSTLSRPALMEVFSYWLLVRYWYANSFTFKQSVAYICNISSKDKTLTNSVTALGRWRAETYELQPDFSALAWWCWKLLHFQRHIQARFRLRCRQRKWRGWVPQES